MENVDLSKYKYKFYDKINEDGYIDPSVMTLIINNELNLNMSIYEIIELVESKKLDISYYVCFDVTKYNYVEKYTEILKEKSIKLLYFVERIQFNKSNKFSYEDLDEYLWEEVTRKLFEYDIHINKPRFINFDDMLRLLQPLIENIKDLFEICDVDFGCNDINKSYQDMLVNNDILYLSRSLQYKEDLLEKRGCIRLSDKQKENIEIFYYDVFDIWMNNVVDNKVKCKKK